jgi:hypothetical protein
MDGEAWRPNGPADGEDSRCRAKIRMPPGRALMWESIRFNIQRRLKVTPFRRRRLSRLRDDRSEDEIVGEFTFKDYFTRTAP